MIKGRLARQIDEFERDPSLVVLGMFAGVFTGEETPAAADVKLAMYPTDGMVAAYALAFSCVVNHPSVMFRKEKVVEVGGYERDKVSEYCWREPRPCIPRTHPPTNTLPLVT